MLTNHRRLTNETSQGFLLRAAAIERPLASDAGAIEGAEAEGGRSGEEGGGANGRGRPVQSEEVMSRTSHCFQRDHAAVGLTAIGVLLAVLGMYGCADLGFRDRVLWRVAAPGGELVAVCQEVPGFDGPSYDVRLEGSDRRVVRRLFVAGDGDPCSEVVWSPDGRTLAVLSGHVARVRFVDVGWVLDHFDIETAVWSWRQVDLSTERERLFGTHLRFVGPRSVELQVCPADTAGRTARCPEASATRRFEIPLPIVTGHAVNPG